MPLHLNKIAAIFLIVLSSSGYAQEVRPEPGSIEVPVQKEAEDGPSSLKKEELSDEEKKTKWGYVRVWNFSGQNTNTSLGFFLGKKASPFAPDALWISRGVPYGSVGQYIRVPVDSYQLLIVNDPVETFDPQKPVVFEGGADRGNSFSLEVKDKEYSTVLVLEEEGRLKPIVWADSELNSTLYSIRAVNFTNLKNVTIEKVSEHKREVLFTDLQFNKAQLKEQSAPERMDLELVTQDEQGFPLRQFVEVELKGCLSTTIIVFYDRYGRVTFRSYGDAPRR